MGDEFHLGCGSWWDSTSSRNRYDSGSTAASTSVMNSNMGSFGWPTEIVAARSSTDSSVSVSVSDRSMIQDPSLQMMGLSLSSQTMDWNQAALFRERAESSFRSILQEEASTNFQQESGVTPSQDNQYWNRQKFYGGLISPNFQVDSASFSSSPNSSNILHGLSAPDYLQQESMNYSYPSSYGMDASNQLMPSWSKFPHFLRTSPPKQQLHFFNNSPFCNASSTGMNEVLRSNSFPSPQTQLPEPNFEEKSKHTSEVRNLPAAKKSSTSSTSESSNKRHRNETPAPTLAPKAKKEKVGDRITALQQLISPFGKTDTASVLTEAIEYIKFLHDQVNVLITPYMKSGAPKQHQKKAEKSKDSEGPKQDLRSRGLCLVPVSSTFPVTHETAVDYWTPTFGVGGTFR